MQVAIFGPCSLRGTASGTNWSVFVKVLHNPRHWRFIDRMPPPARAEFIAEFPWRAELAAWDPAPCHAPG